ncbi:ATP-dependent helicase [uncultured Roseobacter sp.]|uniref:ATP-dependent helicase n=1 Tax=uncultured Roseobacter sp. TaxID=114847 RepID=UPI002622A3AA|nr:UvrD-helicase domain-containing protein [uncultured Roseobacter sp.]
MSSFDEMDAFDGASLSARAMAARPQPYLDGLNPAQRAAVEQLDGPVLMLAGAGTGKTRALTARIVHLLNTGRARPNEVLAVTFTNKAAREMRNRVGQMLGQQVEGMPWLGTFHAICVKLLRRHAELVGCDIGDLRKQGSEQPGIDDAYDLGPVPVPPGLQSVQPNRIHLKSNFTILDTDDQLRLLKQLVSAANIDDKRWPARQLASIIDGWKNRALTPEKVPASDAGAYNHRGTEIYAQYQRRLLELNAVDFGDLLLHMVTIFQAHPDVLAQYQRWFAYILVDEYQDTNVAQYLWLRLLAGGHKNICCVGDDDQSIYGWRGAEVGNILRFEKDFPGAHVVRLEQNYRSTPHILAAASGVIEGNEGRLGKTLFTDLTEGEKVRLIGHWDGEEEARWIGEEVEAAQRGSRGMRKMGLDEIAVLVRTTHQMEAFDNRFKTIGLPYRIIGPRLDDTQEARDAHAYLRVVVNKDNDPAFERIINRPKRGVGDVTLRKLRDFARKNSVSLFEATKRQSDAGQIGGKAGRELQLLTNLFQRWAKEAKNSNATAKELVEAILDESGYTAMWQETKTPDAPGRLEHLKTLVQRLENHETIFAYVEDIELRDANDRNLDVPKVSIMTLHAAKGLEFPVVFLPGWEDGLFPSQRSMDESGMKGLEEERRLAYVGITRAEEVCTISFAANRRVFGQWQSSMPSRFIDELPEEHVEVLTPPGLYGGGYGAAAPTSNLHDVAAEANVYNSPGWRRLQARSQERPVSQPRESKNTVIDMSAVSSFTMGERVFHQKFGYGAIQGIEGDKLEIAFEKAGVKKVVAKFVTGCDDIPF